MDGGRAQRKRERETETETETETEAVVWHSEASPPYFPGNGAGI